MRSAFPSMIIGAFLLAACSGGGVVTNHDGGHDTDHGSMEQSGLTLRDESTDGEIIFSIMDGDAVFIDYGVSHTKEMHLIVVRDDLTHFRHLHPTRDAHGVWRAPFTAPAGGTYWWYADFVDADAKTYTLRFDKQYSGDPGKQGIAKNAETAKIVDGYRIEMSPQKSADYVEFQYVVLDAVGGQVILEDYLGEKGHSILLARDGDFVHTHPHKEYVGYSPSDPPTFIVPRSMLKEDFYRIFTQFQIKGKVITVDFDWEG